MGAGVSVAGGVAAGVAVAAAPTDDGDLAGVGVGVGVGVAATVGAAVVPGGGGKLGGGGGGEYPSTGMNVPYSTLTLASDTASMGRNPSLKPSRVGTAGGVSRPPSTPTAPRGAAAVATSAGLKLSKATGPYWEAKEVSEAKADCGLVCREDVKEEARLEYRGEAAGYATAVPSTMLPACCEVTATLERLTPAAFARHCLYLHTTACCCLFRQWEW